MLLVETKIGPSSVQGIGLFANQFIPKGALIWEYTPHFDIKATKEQLKKLSTPAYKTFLNYCYQSMESGVYILCFDDARFLNHSERPNVIDDDKEEGIVIAARDIDIGEELFADYRTYDSDWSRKLKTTRW